MHIHETMLFCLSVAQAVFFPVRVSKYVNADDDVFTR